MVNVSIFVGFTVQYGIFKYLIVGKFVPSLRRKGVKRMNIIFTVDISSVTNFLKEYNEYKVNFEKNHLKKLDDEYRCRK